MTPFLCLAIALHDVDGPVICRDGTEIRLAGIGATELDGSCRAHQPCVPGDPYAQRRAMAALIGARAAAETPGAGGELRFAAPVPLACTAVGRSYRRTVAWCTARGHDLSCAAIRAGLARRWPVFDRGRRLTRCAR